MTVFGNATYSSDYQGLCNKIADTLNRQDLNTVIPDFVKLATSRIQRDMVRVKHPSSVSRAIATVTNNYATVPQDFIGVYQLMTADDNDIIEYVSPDQSQQFGVSGIYRSSGNLKVYYTIIGNQIRLYHNNATSGNLNLELWYYAFLPELSVTTQSNWALTRYPDLYLYGALVHSAPYLKADDRIPTWESAYQNILGDIEVEADRSVRSQSKISAARVGF